MDHSKDIINIASIPKLTKRESRFMDAAGQVQETPPQERDDVSYWPRGVVQCTLPHSNPGNVRAYVRRSGNYFIMIEPGAKLDTDLGDVDSWGYPYGSYPRLCCSYIAREVRRTKNSRVFLGDTQQNRYTLSAFMAELGLVPTGGRWGTITALRKQIHALVHAKIAFGYGGSQADTGGHQFFAEHWHLWWNVGTDAAQTNLFPSYIDLSPQIYEDMRKAFPVDMRILREMKQSSLALDLYAFATYKVFKMKSATAISWKAMHSQFGSGYKSVDRFRTKALEHLRVIKALYPDFKYTLDRGRIVIWPSRTSVLPIPKKSSED